MERSEMSNSTHAVIVGGGIAGPAIALALCRAGIESVVYEASPVPRDEAGVFLNLAPNGLNVLRALGLDHILDGVGFLNDRLVFFNDAGRTLADMPVGGVTLLRGALSRALREAAIDAGVRFEFAKVLASVEQVTGEVIARFVDGTAVHGQVLIGADGIHSRTRAAVFPDAPKPRYTGIINIGGIVRTDLPPTGRAMHMVFGRRAFFGYAVRPSGETYWFSNLAEPHEPSRGDLRLVSEPIRRQLREMHRDDPAEVTRILQSITGEVGAFPEYDIQSLPAWHRGAVCLIGDAAHAIGPHVGQGASLALEDAFELAKCLRDVPRATDACARFETLRRARVEPIITQSRRTGRHKLPTGWIGRKLRDLVLPMFLRKGAEAAQALYRYELSWEA
jgi:2-polyprenyl-6-methoxyphenol hydroxylase-like FAD-dependent oxidoreductase